MAVRAAGEDLSSRVDCPFARRRADSHLTLHLISLEGVGDAAGLHVLGRAAPALPVHGGGQLLDQMRRNHRSATSRSSFVKCQLVPG